ncbi:MAG: hypothetical protein H6737_31870 [Alphaproteobacteria bacterium]|nr:hypothetical protein [Alphaproteobacteria bacterium]
MLLDTALIDTIVARDPVPMADAVTGLLAAENAHERRDRIVEVGRTAIRLLAALAIAGRHAAGPGPEPTAPHTIELLETLRTRGLTDGQWVGLARGLLQPWAGTPEAHPVPELVQLFHGKRSKLTARLEPLLQMRKNETVAHGATGTAEEAQALVDRREAQLEALLRELRPLWEAYEWVVPLGDGQAWRLRGTTPGRGRWRRRPFEVPCEAGHVMLLGPGDRPVLDLHPVALFRRPTPDAPEEVFLLDQGRRRGGAVYLAVPSMAQHVDEDIWEVLGPSLFAVEATEPPDAMERPYRGLDSFQPEHAALFFGRDEQAASLANRIRRHPVVTVTGPSGSGKSSLVRAGVLPRLADHEVVILLPGARPSLESLPTSSERPLCVVVDQAEELLTLAEPDAAEGFAAGLLGRGEPHRVVFVVREDFFARLASIPSLRGRYARQVEVVTTPDRDALKEILVAPAQAFGYRFEDDDLVEEMVRSVEESPTALALLQFCADRMWDARNTAYTCLTREAYGEVGGVVGALAHHAEHTLSGFTPAGREAARDVFLRLVSPMGTRALVPRATLDGLGDEYRAVVDRLIAARLLVVREDRAGSAVVELVHEALLQHWETLAQWRDEDREGQRQRARIQRAVEDWEGNGRSIDLLWRGSPLDLALRHTEGMALTDGERAFLTASSTREARGNRRRRQLLLLAGTVLWVGLFVVLGLWGTSERLRVEADQRTVRLVAATEARHGQEASAVALLRVFARHALDEGALDWVDRSALWTARTGLDAHRHHPLPAPVLQVGFAGDHVVADTAGGRHAFDVRSGEAVEPTEPMRAPGPWRVDLEDGRLRFSNGARTVSPDRIPCLPLGPTDSNGPWVVVGCPEGLRLWDLERLEVHELALLDVRDIAIREDGAHLAVASGRTVRVWDLDGLVRSALATEQEGGALALALDGDRVVSGGVDGSVAVSHAGRELWRTPAAPLPVVAVRALEHRVASVSAGVATIPGWPAPLGPGEPEVRYVERSGSGEIVREWTRAGGPGWALTDAGDVVLGADSGIRVVAPDGTERTLPGAVRDPDRIWVSPDGRFALASAQDGTDGVLFRLGEDAPGMPVYGSGRIEAAAFDVEGRGFLGSTSGALWRFELLEVDPFHVFDTRGPLRAAWSTGDLYGGIDATGRALVLRTDFDGGSWKLIEHLPPFRGPTLAEASTAASREKAVVVGGRSGRVWSDPPLVTVPRGTGPVSALALSGTHVAVGVLDGAGTVRVLERAGDASQAPVLLEELGRLTNLRVCERSLEVVPVVPYPEPDTVWAPSKDCGGWR